MHRPRRLTAVSVSNTNAKGLYADGDGLYLRVTARGTKSWIYRYTSDGRLRDMGLGPASVVSLARARALALEARLLRHQGTDPILARKAERTGATSPLRTFVECAELFLADRQAAWRNAKHRQQWHNTLSRYVYPTLGTVPVAEVRTEHVLRVLQQRLGDTAAPFWNARTETANRVRGRIEAVLSWAKARGLREGENPAQWRGHLDYLLPSPSKLTRPIHHPALAFRDLPNFMARLRERDCISARLLEFTILTAVRSGEARGARVSEMDLARRMWIIPAERMKAGREHQIPLSPRAAQLAELAASCTSDGLLFTSASTGRPLSDMAMLMLLRDLHPGITTHGFRSTFRDWAAEVTDHPNHVVEMALAHAVSDKVEAAYRRGNLLSKRRLLMEDWEAYASKA